ncbi:hypothetical protein FBQ87_11675 [Sphingobacteriales bacterium CHB3]|nr:hypothetical protein [Sphingobacteriales bacterium CHB3]
MSKPIEFHKPAGPISSLMFVGSTKVPLGLAGGTVSEAKSLGKHVMVRNSLTVSLDPHPLSA